MSAVGSYLRAVEALRAGLTSMTAPADVVRGRELVAAMAEARIVEIRASQVQRLWDDASSFLATQDRDRLIAGLGGPPDPRPFPTVWLGLDQHAPVGDDVPLQGWLIGDREITRLYGAPHYTVGYIYRVGGWADLAGSVPWSPSSGADPWVLHTIFAMIADRQATTIETPLSITRRRRLQRIAEASPTPAPPRHVPRAYHVVDLVDRVRWVSAARKAIMPCPAQSRLSHRFDVRSHQRLRVVRGHEPLEPDLAADLRRRGYSISRGALNEPDLEGALRRRGIPLPRPGEWLATLQSTVAAHQRGPDDGVYVPSSWRLDMDD